MSKPCPLCGGQPNSGLHLVAAIDPRDWMLLVSCYVKRPTAEGENTAAPVGGLLPSRPK